MLEEKQIKIFNDQGFLIVEDMLSSELLDNTRAETLTLNESDGTISYTESGNIERAKFDNLATQNACFGSLALDKRLIATVETLLGEDCLLYRDSLIRRGSYSSSGHHLHQDSAYWPITPRSLVSVWIPLQPVNKVNGSLELIPKSHFSLAEHNLFLFGVKVPTFLKRILQKLSAKSLGQGSKNKNAKALRSIKRIVLGRLTKVLPAAKSLHELVPVLSEDQERSKITTELNYGDALFFHSLLLHGTGQNQTNETRDVYIVSFMAASSQSLEDVEKEYVIPNKSGPLEQKTRSIPRKAKTFTELDLSTAPNIETQEPDLVAFGAPHSDISNGAVIATGVDFEYLSCCNTFAFKELRQQGIWYLDPQPTPQSFETIYPETYNPYHFNKRRGFVRYARDAVQKKKVKEFLKLVRPGSPLLDCGCGSGALLTLLAESKGSTEGLYGNDISTESLEFLKIQGFGVLPGLMDEFSTNVSFGGAVLNQVIEHVRNPRQVLQNIKKHLEPNGVIFIETPSWEGVDAKIFKNRYWGGFHFPRHFVIYSRESLENLLISEGFEIASSTYIASPTFWIQSLHHALIDKGYGWLGAKFTNKNVFLLALFTFIDRTMILFNQPTSNMRIIARSR